MPRQVRIEYEGATYHVMCRGDRREAIFADDADRRMFLASLGEAIARTGWRLHGYVLLSNHYHLLLETPEPNLVRGMAWFQTTYTTRYNARHRTSGHLFGGRYKAVVIDPAEPRYFAAVLAYIHLNPARAGLVKTGGPELLDYGWSSLAGYVRRETRASWLTVQRGFAAHDLEDTAAHRRSMLEDLVCMNGVASSHSTLLWPRFAIWPAAHLLPLAFASRVVADAHGDVNSNVE